MSPGRSDSIQKQQIVGDLISYQNDGKCSAAIVGKVGRA
jgi:hypothetical protein